MPDYTVLLLAGAALAAGWTAVNAAPADLAASLLPPPRQLIPGEGSLLLAGRRLTARLPAGDAHSACREVVRAALRTAGARAVAGGDADGDAFILGEGAPLPPLPEEGIAAQGYVLAVGPRGIAARGASPAGLLHAAQTLRQLARLAGGRLPCLAVRDSPAMRLRGLYIEGGQERFGRVVAKEYLLEQIRRLSELKMNLLVIECYNLFPFPSFPACADAGTLSADDCREIMAEAKRWHVTIVPSLQTLAQASELVWGCDAGASYREVTAPGLTCPSNPDLYPFIKGLYRDLLTLFDQAPLIGVGCSEIDMQWQGRYCPRCQARVDAGETVRDLLLGHAEKCIAAVQDVSRELGRPIRPMIWGDEFYMYGPGKDWVGLERISKETIVGFWKYWPDYAGIAGLMRRGYDVLGISAIYNHCFYLTDLSPEDPPKSWPSMEQTGTRNIADLVAAATAAARAHPEREFLGVATASFSKHRLRAFDTLWHGFALNGHCTWSAPERPMEHYLPAFTRAFARHYYDARTDRAAATLAAAYERLDRCKSQLERANQTLHDVVGVYDTQEAGYLGNTLVEAWRLCREHLDAEGRPGEELARIQEAAGRVVKEATAVARRLRAHRSAVGRQAELDDLCLAAEKIANHAERQILLVEACAATARAARLPVAAAREEMARLARRWRLHQGKVEAIQKLVAPLYTRGDPCGYAALLGDVAMITQHLARLAQEPPAEEQPAGELLLEEPFSDLDPGRWEVLGQPAVAAGCLETRAPGGWGNYCGVLSREAFLLDEQRPLVVEYTLTPVVIGVDSQLFAAAEHGREIAFQFAIAGNTNRLLLHTRSAVALPDGWIDAGAGWKHRASSPVLRAGQTYQVRAEITRRGFRVRVRLAGQDPWDLPFWDSRVVPMDSLERTRLLFADVEPEGGQGASRWGQIRITRAP